MSGTQPVPDLRLREEYSLVQENSRHRKPGVGLSCPSIIFIICVIIGGIVLLFQWITNQLSGCSKTLEEEFAHSSLAQSYAYDWLDQINAEHPYKASEVGWEISAYMGGCKIEAGTRVNNVHYVGDSFLINPRTKRVSPISEGAQIYMSDIDDYIMP
jgi:hypothetical protein